MATPARSRGFTLIELLVTVLVFATAVTAITPLMAQLSTDRQIAARERQANALFKIRTAYLRHRALQGSLPAPYTGGGYRSTIADPGDPILWPLLKAAGLSDHTINDDGSAYRQLRVAQCVPGLTQAANLFGSGGPAVFVTYTHCALYNTRCAFSDPCNSGVPGDSAAMTALNYASWETTGDDSDPVFVSDVFLALQELRQTADRLVTIRSKLRARFNADLLTAAAGSTTNHYPRPNGAGAPDLSGAAPASNQGCRDGWYDLSAANVNVLTQLGLDAAEHGRTVGGGRIEYCPDYDPDGSGGADTPPHFAALRIHRSVSTVATPDGADAVNNAFLSI